MPYLVDGRWWRWPRRQWPCILHSTLPPHTYIYTHVAIHTTYDIRDYLHTYATTRALASHARERHGRHAKNNFTMHTYTHGHTIKNTSDLWTAAKRSKRCEKIIF
jgi:hypothetical protein